MTYADLNSQIDDAERTMRAAEERLRSFTELAPKLAEVTGHGEAADGRIVAEWHAGALQTLTFDPLVMRMPSMDLAAATKEAIDAAIRDAAAQTREVVREAGLEAGRDASPEQLQQRLAEMREQFAAVGRQAAVRLDEAQRRIAR